jgi:hypothetical protein
VLNRETKDGVYVRADEFVHRLNPGDHVTVDFHATRYGRPLATAVIAQPTSGFMGGAGTGANIPGIQVPDVNTPSAIIQFPLEFETQVDGHGSFLITATEQGPGNPRQYIDGQVYGIAYQIKNLPDGYNANPFNYISILAWDRFDVPANPTWYRDILPILTQYGNLYPLMSKRLVDLSSYDSVVANLAIIRLSFSLPLEDPNSMPVTRDLSANKRQTILKWLDAKDPLTGLPPRGETPPPKPTRAAFTEVPGDESDPGSKVGFLRQALKSGKR